MPVLSSIDLFPLRIDYKQQRKTRPHFQHFAWKSPCLDMHLHCLQVFPTAAGRDSGEVPVTAERGRLSSSRAVLGAFSALASNAPHVHLPATVLPLATCVPRWDGRVLSGPWLPSAPRASAFPPAVSSRPSGLPLFKISLPQFFHPLPSSKAASTVLAPDHGRTPPLSPQSCTRFLILPLVITSARTWGLKTASRFRKP